MAKVIYEQRYPKDDLSISLNTLGLDSVQDCVSSFNPKYLSFDDMMDELHSTTVYVALPERKSNVQQFIQTAIDVSSSYEIDIRIEDHISHLTVFYYFNCSGCMGFLKRILTYADDIAFFSNVRGYEIVMAIDYYTHAVYRGGHKINP